MSEPTYPSDEQLETIRKWEYSDFPGLMAFIKQIWFYSDSAYWRQKGDIYWISTVGWSGNEDIIAAMQDNYMIWTMNWYRTTRGGHYIFAPMTVEGIRQIEEWEEK